MISKLNILDERNIRLLISGDVLEVFDQNDNLVGEKTLTVFIEENTSEDEIYRIFEEAGLDLKELCDAILSDSVMVEQIYDFWITEDSVIFYSPTSQEYIAEPLEGIFGKLVAGYDELINAQYEAETVQHFEIEDEDTDAVGEETIVETHENPSETTYEQEHETTNEVVEEAGEVLVEEEQEQVVAGTSENDDLDDLRNAIPNQDHTFRPETTEAQASGITNRETTKQTGTSENRSGAEEAGRTATQAAKRGSEATLEGTKERTRDLQTEEDAERLVSWKQEYLSSLKNNKKVKGISMGQLRDKVVEIVIDSGKSPFELEEKEILFRLATEMEAIFDTQQAIKSGLYQAHLILRD